MERGEINCRERDPGALCDSGVPVEIICAVTAWGQMKRDAVCGVRTCPLFWLASSPQKTDSLSLRRQFFTSPIFHVFFAYKGFAGFAGNSKNPQFLHHFGHFGHSIRQLLLTLTLQKIKSFNMPKRPLYPGEFTWHLDDNHDAYRRQRREKPDAAKRQRMSNIRQHQQRNNEVEEVESQQRLSELAAQRYNLIIL